MKMIPATEYREINAVHFSGLKAFAKCPRYYFEKYIEKTLVEPDRDYFLYGSLVDAIVTEPDTVPERFIQVARRNEGGALELEIKIGELESELKEIYAKPQNKVTEKGIDSRLKKIAELRAQAAEAQAAGAKEQVPKSIWDDAHETAAAILSLPTIREYLDQGFTMHVQPSFVDDATNRKGRLDILFTKGEEAVIIDVKTTYKLVDLDPIMYAGQLAFYRELVRGAGFDVIDVLALVGDKVKERKLAQDFRFSEETLDFAWQNVLQTEEIFLKARTSNEWPSAKQLRGRSQNCFTCSHCANRPFSIDKPFNV